MTFRKWLSRINQKNAYSLDQTTPWNIRPLNATIGNKTVEHGKIRTKNASPDMFNFYVVLAGRDKAGLPRAGQ